MEITITTKLEKLDWHKLSVLYDLTGFKNKSPERLQLVYKKSSNYAFAYDDNNLIGAVRAFSDGIDCFVICDMAVLPEFQNKGIGSKLMKELLLQIREYDRIMLYATLGKEFFYKKFGFGLMTSGMCKFNNQEKAILSGYILE